MYVLTNIVSIVINAVILAMMIKLRDASCHCLVDWRNWFIVVYSSLVIVLSLVGIVMRLAGGKKKKNIKELSTLSSTMFVISLVMTASILLNIYALYSYTKDLETSQCDCITSRNSQLFGFIYYYIRVSLILVTIGLILVGIGYLRGEK